MQVALLQLQLLKPQSADPSEVNWAIQEETIKLMIVDD